MAAEVACKRPPKNKQGSWSLQFPACRIAELADLVGPLRCQHETASNILAILSIRLRFVCGSLTRQTPSATPELPATQTAASLNLRGMTRHSTGHHLVVQVIALTCALTWPERVWAGSTPASDSNGNQAKELWEWLTRIRAKDRQLPGARGRKQQVTGGSKFHPLACCHGRGSTARKC